MAQQPFLQVYLSSLGGGMNKVAAQGRSLSERDKPEGVEGNDVVPMDTFSGGLADIFSPLGVGGHRAGRSEAMARSVGKDPGVTVEYPGLTSTLPGMIGGGVGGAIGYGVGRDVGLGNAGGAVAGGLLGMIATMAVSGLIRRSAMKKNNQAFDEADSVRPYGRGWNPVDLFGGSHAAGRASGMGAMMGKGSASPNAGSKLTTTGGVMDYLGKAVGVAAPYSGAGPLGSLGGLVLSLPGSISGGVKGNRDTEKLVASEGKKEAAAGQQPPAAYHGMAFQRYLPPSKRRTELSPDEQSEVREEKSKWFPRIFKSEGDPISVDMASEGKSSLMGGALLGIPGAIYGASAGAGAGPKGALIGGGIGGGAGAIIGALLGKYIRKAKNRTVEERMLRFPEGSRRRDLMSDPTYQSDLDRDAMLQSAVLRGVGSFRR